MCGISTSRLSRDELEDMGLESSTDEDFEGSQDSHSHKSYHLPKTTQTIASGLQGYSDRAAVIPYTVFRDPDGKCSIFFLFGIDLASGDITDFGGGVKKSRETALQGALREFLEEIRYIFESSVKNLNTLRLSTSLFSERMSVIFLPVECEWFVDAEYKFSTAKINTKTDEISRVAWFSSSEVQKLVRGKYARECGVGSSRSEEPGIPAKYKMWSRLRDFYKPWLTDPEFLENLVVAWKLQTSPTGTCESDIEDEYPFFLDVEKYCSDEYQEEEIFADTSWTSPQPA